MAFSGITHDSAVMDPCIRGLRIGVGLVASGVSRERILAAYPLLEAADLDALEARAIRA
jgi:uncharacterized protein (DUF433 family)